jgi:hypothetical protein
VFNDIKYKILIGQEMVKIKNRQALKQKIEDDAVKSSCSFQPVLATSRSRSSSAQGTRSDSPGSAQAHLPISTAATGGRRLVTDLSDPLSPKKPFHETLSTTHKGNVAKMKQLESEIAAVLTFKPKIPETSERMVEEKTHITDPSGRSPVPKYEKLYQEGLRHRIETEKEREALQQDMLDIECTFTPNINPKSHKLTGRSPRTGTNGGLCSSSRDSKDAHEAHSHRPNQQDDVYINNTVSIFERLNTTPTAAFVMKDPKLDPKLALLPGQEQNKPPGNNNKSPAMEPVSSDSSIVTSDRESETGAVLPQVPTQDTRRHLQEMLLSVKEELEMGQCTFAPRLTTTGPVIAYQNKNVFSRLSEPA